MPELPRPSAEVIDSPDPPMSSSPMSLDTPKLAGLERYIQRIHYPGPNAIPPRIFDRGICHTSPILHSGRCNRILMYPGSFNPPHHGHLELLQHAFGDCGSDLNVIAAIIVPLNDNSLERKTRNERNAKVFTKAERVRLWQDMVPSDWYWVYDRDTKKWSEFRKTLVADAGKDGFEIDFMVLVGSDYVTRDAAPTGAWSCKNFIVSDISRPADFFSPDLTAPLDVKGYKPWREHSLDVDVDALKAKARENAADILARLILMSPSMFASSLEKSAGYMVPNNREAQR
ncbi:MAG: hypothetical protein Q9169_008610 [Polycauliona sp. 2 TL-2023]